MADPYEVYVDWWKTNRHRFENVERPKGLGSAWLTRPEPPCLPEIGDAYFDASASQAWILTEDGWTEVTIST